MSNNIAGKVGVITWREQRARRGHCPATFCAVATDVTNSDQMEQLVDTLCRSSGASTS